MLQICWPNVYFLLKLKLDFWVEFVLTLIHCDRFAVITLSTYQAFSHHRWSLWYQRVPRSSCLSHSLLSVLGHCWRWIKYKHTWLKISNKLKSSAAVYNKQIHSCYLWELTCYWLLIHLRNVSGGTCPWFSLRSYSLLLLPKRLPLCLHAPRDEVIPCRHCLHGRTGGDYPQSFHTAGRWSFYEKDLWSIYVISNIYITFYTHSVTLWETWNCTLITLLTMCVLFESSLVLCLPRNENYERKLGLYCNVLLVKLGYLTRT